MKCFYDEWDLGERLREWISRKPCCSLCGVILSCVPSSGANFSKIVPISPWHSAAGFGIPPNLPQCWVTSAWEQEDICGGKRSLPPGWRPPGWGLPCSVASSSGPLPLSECLRALWLLSLLLGQWCHHPGAGFLHPRPTCSNCFFGISRIHSSRVALQGLPWWLSG